jgi:hypothetical protein
MQIAHYIITWVYYGLMIIAVKGLVQINIPYVDYFYKWKENKFIKIYTSLCQFHEIGKFKWPPANLSSINPHTWFNNDMFIGTGIEVFSQIKKAFLVKEFAHKKGKKKENKKTLKALRFWNNAETRLDKITKIFKFKSKEKQQVLVIYQSDDNYVKSFDSNIDESVPYTGEHSLLFVFYLSDKTQIYRINNAEILQKESERQQDNITYFYIYKTKLERIMLP